MRLIFAGTPDAAVPSLRRLLDSRHEVVAVLTRPDAPAGRGRRLVPSPVRVVAEEAGVPVLTPTGLRDPEVVAAIADLEPDCCPVVAYGNLVPPALLDVPRYGWLNLHFSLLPAWRGAAPVQHAIINGDTETGAAVFRLEAGLDTGPVFGEIRTPIADTDSSDDVLTRLAELGATLLADTLDAVDDGSAVATPQASDGVSLAPKLEVADARVDWSEPAEVVDRLIRGCYPNPGAWTTFRGDRVKLDPASIERASIEGLPPGELDVTNKRVLVGTGSGALRLGVVRAAGKKPMPAPDWARGSRPEAGERFE